MPAMGITDHGTMFGVIDFFNEAKYQGVKPIIGVEAYLAHNRMTDKDPGRQQVDPFAAAGREHDRLPEPAEDLLGSTAGGILLLPRIDHEFLAAHSEGLIATSGCMAAEVPRAIQQENPQEALRRLDWYYEVFGPERFFIELAEPRHP